MFSSKHAQIGLFQETTESGRSIPAIPSIIKVWEISSKTRIFDLVLRSCLKEILFIDASIAVHRWVHQTKGIRFVSVVLGITYSFDPWGSQITPNCGNSIQSMICRCTIKKHFEVDRSKNNCSPHLVVAFKPCVSGDLHKKNIFKKKIVKKNSW